MVRETCSNCGGNGYWIGVGSLEGVKCYCTCPAAGLNGGLERIIQNAESRAVQDVTLNPDHLRDAAATALRAALEKRVTILRQTSHGDEKELPIVLVGDIEALRADVEKKP